MNSNSALPEGSAFLTTSLASPRQSTPTHSTAYVVGEYFISVAGPMAKSDIDYLVSPIAQICIQINAWLSRFGSQTVVETVDATLLVAPLGQIPQEYFDSYESIFKAVEFYRTSVGHRTGMAADVPSKEQKNAALLGLANLILARMPAPSPMFLEDGTVGAYWRRGLCYASIDFEVDGEHSWAGTDGTNYISGTWKVPDEPLPPALISELLSISY
ncbi:MAG: hypothetical protein JWM78_625 [Verrucomicrobiaceae bacterium]|nr:hypothetical protein [Verrucomicrobiaceae bacterium]